MSSKFSGRMAEDDALRLMVQSVEDYAVLLLDVEGRVCTWNAGAERLHGYRADEIIGRHFSVFYPEPKGEEGRAEAALCVVAEKGSTEEEGWRLRKDGSRFWANATLSRVRDGDGSLIAFGLITRDITARRQAEQRYRQLVEGVVDYAIYSLDAEGNVTSWNAGAERLKGYTASEIIGRHFSTFYTAEDRAAGLPAKVLATARRDGHFTGEGWRVRKDGRRFWSSVVVTPLYGDDGHLTGYSKITRDMSERRQAEKRYRQLVEGVVDYAIYSLDVNGNLTSWNAGAQRLKGYSAEEILGRHFSMFYTPEDRAAGLPAQVLANARREGHFTGEGWRVRKDGSRFWSSVVVTPLYDDDGQLSGYSKVTRDMTDRKMLLDQIQAHARELEQRIAEREQTNAELEAFSYSVSHDLRAPLRAIQGFAQILWEDFGEQLPPEARQFLEQISTSATRMSRLVQDLLEYSRLGRSEMALEAVSLLQAIEHGLEQLGETARAVQVDVSPGIQVLAHAATLTQVFTNLAGNAVKFTRPGIEPQVTISARERGDSVVVSVTDNGIGIAPQHQERVFQVFERLHTNEQYPGTGIGLAIVRRAVHRMHGSIGIESQLNQGSTFVLQLKKAEVKAQIA